MDNQQEQSNFSGWAIIDQMGHKRNIGFVTTRYFGGPALFQVDTPGLPEREYEIPSSGYHAGQWLDKGSKVRKAATEPLTQFVGPQSIYNMIACTEEAALKALEANTPREIILLEAPKEKQLAVGMTLPGEEEEDHTADNDLEEDYGDEEETRI